MSQAKKTSTAKKNTKKHNQKPKRHLIRNLVGLGVVGTITTTAATVAGAWGAWQYVKAEAHNRRRHTSAFNKVVTANRYCGLVHRSGDEFTLTTASATYHVVDPLAIIDSIAKQHAQNRREAQHNKPSSQDKKNIPAVNDYYDINVCVVAELSQKGHYGYLGHLDYQLTIVEAAEPSIQDLKLR